MWTPRWLSQRFLARVLGALASFYRFAFAGTKAIAGVLASFSRSAFAGVKAIVTILEVTLKFVALPVTIWVFGFVLVYVYREVSRDALIIASFSVPKQFEEAGFTPDVVAHQISNA